MWYEWRQRIRGYAAAKGIVSDRTWACRELMLQFLPKHLSPTALTEAALSSRSSEPVGVQVKELAAMTHSNAEATARAAIPLCKDIPLVQAPLLCK